MNYQLGTEGMGTGAYVKEKVLSICNSDVRSLSTEDKIPARFVKNLKASMAKGAFPDQDELVVLMLGSGCVSIFFAAIRVVTKLVHIIDVSNFGGGQMKNHRACRVGLVMA